MPPLSGCLEEPWTSETVRVRWGVMDDYGQVTECPSEHDAREYQAQHGGDLASRTTTLYTFARTEVRRSAYHS
jgi:hypothetical protein